VAAGGRKTKFDFDEFARFKRGEDSLALTNTQHVTNCRFLISTFRGDSGAYYEAASGDFDSDLAVKVVLDWKDNPTQNQTLYKYEGGRILPCPKSKITPVEYRQIETQHVRLRKRGYVLEGSTRSIWYNNHCLRKGSTPMGIAEELDMNPHGSVAKVFSSEVLALAKATKVLPPLLEGRLVYNSETGKIMAPYIIEAAGGELSLWVLPGLDGQLPPSSYVLGADICSGKAGDYTSNSVACVIDKMTGVQVAEWVSNSTVPIKFAYVCAALARWFHNALVIPEVNFDVGYLKALMEDAAYDNVYMRENKIEGLHKKTKAPGFWMTSDDTRLKVFGFMQEAMCEDAFTPRSGRLIDECKEYQWKEGRIIHVASEASRDDSGKKKAHGDRVIAAAMAWHGCEDTPYLGDTSESELPIETIPPGCMADLLKKYDDRKKLSENDTWDESGVDIFPRGMVGSSGRRWG
jgi:hypothetical protein